MDIGYQQCLLRRPVDGFLGKQPEFGLFQLYGQVRSHAAEFIACGGGFPRAGRRWLCMCGPLGEQPTGQDGAIVGGLG